MIIDLKTTYLQRINSLLRPEPSLEIGNVVDLFCGCGGLSLGFAAAGFRCSGFDGNEKAIATKNANNLGDSRCVLIDENFECPKSDVIIGGPPCQPFSELGLKRGAEDRRNGFPAFVRCLANVRPKIWLFENVPGLLMQKDYFGDVLAQCSRLGYRTEIRLFDASEFGVPQRRRRLVVVGWRKGNFTWAPWKIPSAVVRDAIGRSMVISGNDSKFLTESMELYIAKYEKASKCSNPRDLIADKPSRTITCRNLAGATGDMLRVRLPDGRRRMLTVREAARLQSFPDWFKFVGSESSQFNQIGNAVPPLLSLYLGHSVAKAL